MVAFYQLMRLGKWEYNGRYLSATFESLLRGHKAPCGSNGSSVDFTLKIPIFLSLTSWVIKCVDVHYKPIDS